MYHGLIQMCGFLNRLLPADYPITPGGERRSLSTISGGVSTPAVEAAAVQHAFAVVSIVQVKIKVLIALLQEP